MGFVSYAQNFEDVILWRALGGAGPGFWIDVGAADPVIDSVTLAFSRRGWRGINVEPRDNGQARLRAARPRDINLAVALGAAPGRLTFHEYDDGGLSTLDADIAARHRAADRPAREREVEVTTLAAICAAHADEVIHFLKIDVEGAERAVLEGADFVRFRPWVMLIEATLPQSQVDASAHWEPLVLAAGYRFAWFDGLNRFYIAAEKWDDLSAHFGLPPNLFDGFRLAGPAELAAAEARFVVPGAVSSEQTSGRSSVPRRLVGGLARRIRGFLSAEVRDELASLRQEVVQLRDAVEALAARDERR